MLDLPLADLMTLLAALAVASLLVGVLAGLFGIGGGAVIVPVLYQVLLMEGYDPDILMHIAIGSSLGVIIPTSIRSFMAHKKRGVVDVPLLTRWAPWIVLGVAGGAVIANYVSGEEMKVIFSVLIAILGLRLLIGTGGVKLGDEMPGLPVIAVSGLVIGSSSSLMGIGGGVLATTLQTLFGRPILPAIATSSGVGVLIAIPGAIGFMIAGWGEPGLPPLSLGFVNLPAVLLMIPLSILAAPAGVALAHRLSKRTLELSFGTFLLVVSSRFLIGLVV